MVYMIKRRGKKDENNEDMQRAFQRMQTGDMDDPACSGPSPSPSSASTNDLIVQEVEFE